MTQNSTAPLTPEEAARLADLLGQTPPLRPMPPLTPKEAGDLRDIVDRFLASGDTDQDKADFIRQARSVHTNVLGPTDPQEAIEDLQHVRQRLDEMVRPN